MTHHRCPRCKGFETECPCPEPTDETDELRCALKATFEDYAEQVRNQDYSAYKTWLDAADIAGSFVVRRPVSLQPQPLYAVAEGFPV